MLYKEKYISKLKLSALSRIMLKKSACLLKLFQGLNSKT